MGQLITVNTASSTKDTRTFVLDRSLTGMENFNFTTEAQTQEGDSPAHVIAGRILKLGAKSVSVYSNVITVLGDESFFETNNDQMILMMEKLYLYYGPDAGWAPETQN